MKKLLAGAVIVFVLTAAIVVSLVSIRNSQKPEGLAVNQSSSPTGTGPDVSQNELIIGQPDAKATIIEYADYKCPSCNDFHQKAGKQLRDEYVATGKLKIVFRPYPVFGEDSGIALYGSYCAQDQGKFTEYHDALFDFMWNDYYSKGNHDAAVKKILTPEKLEELATQAGIGRSVFSDCLQKRDHDERFNTALEQAADDGIQGTPSFMANGKKIVGPQPFHVFKTLIDIQLK